MPARSTPRHWRASAASCTSPGRASATTAGPTSTSSRSCAAGPEHRPARGAAGRPRPSRRRSSCRARPSVSTATAGTQLIDEAERGRHRLPRRCLRRLGGRDGAAEEAGVRVVHLRTGIVLSVRAARCKKQLRCSSSASGGSFGSGPAVAELDHYRGRGRRHPPPSGRRRPRRGEPDGATRPQRRVHPDARPRARRPSFLPIPSFGPKLLSGSGWPTTCSSLASGCRPGCSRAPATRSAPHARGGASSRAGQARVGMTPAG